MGGQVESEEQSGERRTERRARNRAESEEQSGEREEGRVLSPLYTLPHYALRTTLFTMVTKASTRAFSF